MERIPCYELKDHQDFPNGITVPFPTQLRVELICSACDAITPKGTKDGKGHSFCQECSLMQTDSANRFTCLICGWQGDRSSMKDNAEEWAMLQQMRACCPNKKLKCPYNATFQQVLRHYERCEYTGKMPCGLCGTALNKKAHTAHILNECPNRILQCVFCRDDVEACMKTAHETNCPQRPGACEHCRKQFTTYLQLERDHYPMCPRMPLFCPYKLLGCDYEGPRSAMAEHVSEVSHCNIIADAFCRQQTEIKELTKENATLKERIGDLRDLQEENAALKKRVSDLEVHQKAEEYLRGNMGDALEDLREEVRELKAASSQRR